MNREGRRVAWIAAALTAAVACQEPLSNSLTPATNLSVYVVIGDTSAKSVTLNLNDTVRVAGLPTDIFKRAVPARVSFTSRNVLIASVTTGGLVKGLRDGTVYVLGSALGVNNTVLLDSVLVKVNVPCTLEARAGIVIATVDSISGSSGPFAAVSYVAKEGTAYKDSLLIANVPAPSGGIAFRAGLAYERIGTYDVTVKANTYRAWTKSGVVVAKDACHVIPVNLTAKLVAQ